MTVKSDTLFFWCNGVPQDGPGHGLPLHHPAVLYGESAFETLRVIEGQPLYLSRHLNRLQHTVQGLGLAPTLDLPLMEEELLSAAAALPDHPHGWRSRITLVSDRLSVNGIDGGAAPIQRWIMMVPLSPTECPPLRVAVSAYEKIPPRSLPSSWKHGNYLSSLISLRQAQQRGFDDALLLTSEGFVTEATSANLFWVRDGELKTCRDEWVFAGITRERVIQHAENEQIPVHQGEFTLEDLNQAEEVFTTSSIRGVCPVTSVESTRFRVDQKEGLTALLAHRLKDQDEAEVSRSCR